MPDLSRTLAAMREASWRDRLNNPGCYPLPPLSPSARAHIAKAARDVFTRAIRENRAAGRSRSSDDGDSR